MPDTLTAADASARPHPAPPPSVIPAMAGDVAAPQDGPAPTKPAALFRAATGLLPVLEAGRALDAAILRRAMSTAFGASDTQGAWVWKDAYEAAEAALVLFLQRYARLMRREAGAGPDGPAAMLAMLETLAGLEPSQTRRSEEQLELQQFSTPLPLAYAALQAAAVQPGDTVLEPSAGTGMLAVMAQCALGDRTAGALHLNELAGVRAGLLARLFPDAPVTRHNAEAIADRLPAIAPSVVLMNPPFSVSPGVNRMRHDADLRHLRSAFSLLPAGGRLAAITSANCIPGDAAWADAFERLDACVVFSTTIDGRAYARRGTTFDTRLTVLDKGGKDRDGLAIDTQTRVIGAAGLLAAVSAHVPPRLSVEVAALPAADLFGHRPAPCPAPGKRGNKVAAKPEPQASRQKEWGPVSELSYEIVVADADGEADAIEGDTGKLDAGPYDPWAPRTVRIESAKAHPTPLVQSAAMAAVSHPALAGEDHAFELGVGKHAVRRDALGQHGAVIRREPRSSSSGVARRDLNQARCVRQTCVQETGCATKRYRRCVSAQRWKSAVTFRLLSSTHFTVSPVAASRAASTLSSAAPVFSAPDVNFSMARVACRLARLARPNSRPVPCC